MKVHVLLKFVRLTPLQKIPFANNIVQKIQGNPHFPLPDVPLPDITDAANTLGIKIQVAALGGAQATQEMYSAEAALDELLRRTAKYVDRIANGDALLITEAGFEASKAVTSAAQIPAKQESMKVERGAADGSLVLAGRKVDGAKFYYTVITTSPALPFTISDDAVHFSNPVNTELVITISTNNKRNINGLMSGVRYYLTSYAGNAAGMGPASDVVSIIAP